jgi:PAS domain S-box-containing protein
MAPASPSSARRYCVAVCFVVLALLLRWLLWPMLGPEIPFLFLWPAVIAAAWYGGLGPGLVATIAAALAEDFILLGPGSIGTATLREFVGLVLFMLLGSSLSWLIAKLHRARRQAEQHRKWLQTTLASIGDAVIATDEQGRIAFLNPVAQALTGWKHDEAVGQSLESVFRVVPELTRPCPENPARENGAPAEVRVTRTGREILLARHGARSSIEQTAAPIRDGSGEVRGVVRVFRDVSEKQHMEDALRQQAEQLIEADRRKNEFLAMLGHELRNPLAPICNAISLLCLKETTDSEVSWARAVISRQVGHMTRLIDDLLDVSRIKKGKITLHKERVELADILERGVEASRHLLEERKHELIERLPREPIWMEADSVRLVQVVTNLLTNAAKYTDERGQITLAVEKQGPHIVLHVKDNGIGITPEMLPCVFDLFSQASSALDRSQGGLGIGLTLVRMLVEMHGGSVEARSAGLGEGSEFLVRLPVLTSQPTHAVPSLPSPESSPATFRSILVVDDNVDAAVALARLLRMHGHRCETAYDGQAALRVARTFQPEVVLLDIRLPGLDGYQVAGYLRQEFGERLVLAAVTGYGQEDDRQRSKQAGFNVHLTKPVDVDALQSLLASPDAARGAECDRSFCSQQPMTTW